MTEDNWTNPLSGDSGTVPLFRPTTKTEGVTSTSVAVDAVPEEVRPGPAFPLGERRLKERCLRRAPRGKR